MCVSAFVTLQNIMYCDLFKIQILEDDEIYIVLYNLHL